MELEIIILNKVNKEKHFFFICGVSLEFLNVFVSFGIATDIRTLLRALGEEFSGEGDRKLWYICFKGNYAQEG